MKKVIVIGGGFAGLSAACSLSEKGIQVELLEASPKLGGRAYSLLDEATGQFIDNGQHLLMGCYKYSLDFLRRVGASKNFDFISPLKLCYVENGGQQFELNIRSNLYPFNLLSAVFRFRALSFRNRIKLLLPLISLLLPIKHKNCSVEQWLKRFLQNDETIERFWELLTVSSMNAGCAEVSAETFKRMLRIIFLNGNRNTALVIPKMDLNAAYVYFARDFIEKNGGRISLSEKVKTVELKNGKAVSILTDKRQIADFDSVVLAVPSFSVNRILENASVIDADALVYSPILTLHLWLKSNPFTERIYGLIKSDIHWLFNHGSHVSLVISSANEFLNENKEEVTERLLTELQNYFPVFYRDLVVHTRLLIEKRAAFVETLDTERIRKKFAFCYGNVVLAGDWTNTKLPATVEGAVKSGVKAAEKILKSF